MKTMITLYAATLAMAMTANAQTGKLFTAVRELSSSMVHQVYQDRMGVIWIATENGLDRYDGVRFTTYKNEAGNRQSLSSDFVNNVFEDSHGHFFVSTYDGLNLLDRAQGTFKRIPLQSRGYASEHANVQMATQRRNGDVLVAVAGFEGIYSVHFDGDSVVAKNTQIELPYAIVNLIFEDSKRRLWYSAEGRGLYCHDGKHNVQARGTPHTTVHAMCEDRQGRIFAGFCDGGLFMLDNNARSFRQADFAGKTAGLKVRALLTDIDGNILIGTDGDGLKSFNPTTLTLADVKVNTMELSTENMKVHSLLRDKCNDLWIGAYQKGVLLQFNTMNGFELIGWRSTTARLGSSACVMSVIKTRSGTTLIGTDGDGLYAVSPQGSVRHYAHTAAANSVPATITALFEDSRGTVWIGSYMEGMARIDIGSGTCGRVNTLLNSNGQMVKSINSFAEDRNGRLWIGSNGDGLFSMELSTGRITDWTETGTSGGNIYNKWVNKVLTTSDGRVYVGTFGGMSCLDTKKKSWTSAFGTNHLLPNEVVNTLFEDEKHNIWAGTTTALVSIDPRNGKTQRLTMDDGLPSNSITGILPDRHGNLWLSTSHGLSCFDPKRKKFINYYADNGLQSNEFSKNAAYGGEELMFGGTNGVTRFRPENITVPERKPQVMIASFFIHDQMVKPGMKSGFWQITKDEPMKSEKFSLAHSDNSFNIEFTAMEFYDPTQVTYSYSMNNNQYISLPIGVNHLSFNRLPAGTYHFKVRSCVLGVYSDPIEFTVTIHPAWYASPIAYLIYIVLIATAAWYIRLHLKRKHQLKQRMQELGYAEQVKEAKLQLLINISHEIRTPMQLIVSPLQKLISTDKDTRRQSEYSIIMRHTQRVIRLINLIMDLRKIDKGKMQLRFRKTNVNSLVADVCNLFSYQMEERHITFTLTSRDKNITAWLDNKHFDKILANLLSNALKFTPPYGKITVSLSAVDDGSDDVSGSDKGTDCMARHFQLTVSDTGIGIEPDKMSHIFERFYQIGNNVTDSTPGTGVGLNLVHQLVTLHHGTITVNNNTPEKGCTFTVRIPLGRAHLSDDQIVEGETVTSASRDMMQEMAAEKPKPTEQESVAKSKTRYRILFVEDDADIREYVTKELSTQFHVATCEDGQQAWDKIRRETFNLIISDIMMPNMDGLTLCHKIRQNIKTNTVPIILLSAKTLEDERIKGLNTGADAYITKPFSISYLKTVAMNMLRNRDMLRTNLEGRQEQEIDITALKEETPNENLMRRIMNVINENISDPSLSIDTIAREVGISRVHLYRKLKELTNQSARDFLRNVRLRHATELIKLGNTNITRVAELTGFSSAAVFSHAFKELYGVPPKEFTHSDKEP